MGVSDIMRELYSFEKIPKIDRPRPGGCRNHNTHFTDLWQADDQADRKHIQTKQYLVLTNLYNRTRTAGKRVLPVHLFSAFCNMEVWENYGASGETCRRHSRTSITEPLSPLTRHSPS